MIKDPIGSLGEKFSDLKDLNKDEIVEKLKSNGKIVAQVVKKMPRLKLILESMGCNVPEKTIPDPEASQPWSKDPKWIKES